MSNPGCCDQPSAHAPFRGDLENGDYRVWYSHAVALAQAGRKADALRSVEEALRLCPEGHAARPNLERMRASLGG